MNPSDVFYLSSDDEPVFDRNERLLREHHEREDRYQIQSHLSRVLEEVKEGKRKFLRTSAFPETSSIPIVIPLYKTLTIIVAYELGDLTFHIMYQESQTGSLPPFPAVTAENFPFDALQYKSIITHINQISSIHGKHGLEVSPDILVRATFPHERSCHAPKGSDKLRYAAWSQEHLRAGAFLPFRRYFANYLNYVKIVPFQLQTNGYRILSALKSLYHTQCWGKPSPEQICYLRSLKNNSPRAHGGEGFYYFASWPQESRLFKDVPNKPPHIRDKFFWTGALKGRCNRSFNRARKYLYPW